VEYRNLGRSGLVVSELCLGTMQFGWTADEEASGHILDAFLETGGNFIDTADIYSAWAVGSHAGKTEEILGRWIHSRGNRADIVLATKVRGRMWDGPNGEGLSRAHIVRACEDSLRRLQTDYIDLYQCHWADLNTPIDETVRALDDLVRAGKVRYLGASNYPAWRLMEALWASSRNGASSFVSYQPEWSLMERKLFEYEAAPLCKHYGLGVIPYSPLAGGWLTGKYRRDQAPDSIRAEGNLRKYGSEGGFAVLDALHDVARDNGKSVTQTSLAWLLTNPLCTSPIIGANTIDQLNDALGASGYRLTGDQMASLSQATAWERNWRPIWD
jgi:aryl-alcohol dehydrogenase-like predicted oxidoreductase